MYRILALDGGGVRGLVTALVLQEIETRTQRRIADLFDLVAATSTGAIVGLALLREGADGRPARTAQEVVDYYLATSRTVFDRSAWQRVGSGEGLVQAKYRSAALERVLRDEFGDVLLTEALCEVLVATYDVRKRGPHFFKSREMRSGVQRLRTMRDVLRATSAAPTYFTPARMGRGREDPVFIDGGVVANNPALCAYAHALDLVRQGAASFGADDIVVLSLGSGEVGFDYATNGTLLGGALAWAKPMLDIVLDAQENVVEYQMARLLPCTRYRRLQPDLSELVGGRRTRVNEIDNASRENLSDLRIDTVSFLERQAEDLTWIAETFTPPAGSA